MPLIESKNLILIDPPVDTEFKNCNLIVTVEVEEKHLFDTCNLRYHPKLKLIFEYLGLEKKLIKLHRACDIDKNGCSKFILDNFPHQEYKEVYEVWTLPNINDEMWANYKIFRVKGLPEQDLLRQAKINLDAKLKELQCNLKDFHAKHQKPKSKKPSSPSLKTEVG